jgi:ABC-2 type transport system permease protein
MFDDKKLWSERAGQRVKDLGRYLKYIFNGHLMIVVLFLLGSAGYYYQNWIKDLSADFPAEIVMGVILAFFLTQSPVYNFLLEADQVFLLPLETKLKGYFYRSGVISLIFQGYLLLLVLAVFMPMYAHVNKSGFRLFLPFLLLLIGLKVWNLACSWRIQYFVQPAVYRWDWAVRYLINAAFLFLLFKQVPFIILIVLAVVMILYYRSFSSQTKARGLKWDLLIAHEERRMNSFYRLANLFTDVPQLKDTVKRRKYLDFLLQGIHFSQQKTYHYLYARTFLRSGDYLGLFTRLTVIGGAAIYFLSFGIGMVFLAVLFLFLTAFQLLPLYQHHQHKFWIDLYPTEEKAKTAAFQFLLMTMLIIQTAVFAAIMLVKQEWTSSIMELAAGTVFSYFFVYIYSKNRLNKAQ